jgi:hypothetical protein
VVAGAAGICSCRGDDDRRRARHLLRNARRRWSATIVATALTICAIAAPGAQAGALSGPGADPPGAGQCEAQGFQRIYSHPASTPSGTAPAQATATNQGFQYGDAAVGAGIASGIALLTAAGGLTVRRRGQLRHS